VMRTAIVVSLPSVGPELQTGILRANVSDGFV
jgi:hypothetical protein